MNKFLKWTLVFTFALVMYIGLAQTTTFAATIGQQLVQPEDGWKRYGADTNNLFKYGNTWDHLTDEKAKIPYSGSKQGTPGDLSFNFKGTGLRLLTSVNNTYSSKVAVSIDGNVEYFKPRNESVTDYNYNVLVYEKTGLKAGVHEVKIWVVEKSPNPAGNEYRLYSIDVMGELTAEVPTEEPPVTEEPPAAERAILVVTMTTGLEKEFDLSMTEVNSFIDWYESKQAGVGKASYAIDKHDNNKGPFKSRKDYVLFDRILTFEVSEY